MKKIAFSSLSTHRHQIVHLLPVAMVLAKQPDVEVTFLTKKKEEEDFITRLAGFYDSPPFRFLRLFVPKLLEMLQKFRKMDIPPKTPLSLRNIKAYRNFDAIVVPDITSAYLKEFSLGSAKLIKLPHGCGDRDVILDKRMGMFDLTAFPGERHRKRLLETKIVQEDHCTVVGYPKFEFIRQIGSRQVSFFKNQRPTVVYIPHFKQKLASWKHWGKKVLSFFANSREYNLILAPHVRLYSEGRITYKELKYYQRCDNIHIDLNSDRCIDMTYTSCADIYLGDVSSQVYEFITNPRPCIFLNAHQVSWEGDPSYAFWHLGQVVDDPDQLREALTQARREHPNIYKQRQEEYLKEIFSDTGEPPSLRAANAIRFIIDLPPVAFPEENLQEVQKK